MSGEALQEDPPAGEHDATTTIPDADETERDDGRALAPPTAFESLVNALVEAGPDVAEHVVKAAQELLLAVQVVVDAAETAVQEQRDVRDSRAASGTDDEPASDDSVRHLDVAE